MNSLFIKIDTIQFDTIGNVQLKYVQYANSRKPLI